MKRIAMPSRLDWKKTVESQGLTYHTTRSEDGSEHMYWKEDAAYEFTLKQIEEIEKATNDISKMCLDAVQHVIDNDRFEEFRIPQAMAPYIIRTWNEEQPSIYGRLDLGYDGKSPPKLLEYNADTPTMLLESSVIQWYWLQDNLRHLDQFNSVHERLVEKWKDIKPYLKGEPLHFAHLHYEDNPEDSLTITYLRDTAEEAGIRTSDILISDVGYDAGRAEYVDLQDEPIRSIFKLYPWEWMINEEGGAKLTGTQDKTQWIEPAWKMILSNKSILPLLWELNPGHPNLLEAYNDEPRHLKEYVRKPRLSREGANIQIKSRDINVETDGEYGDEGHIYQAYMKLPVFNGRTPILGSWLIDHEASGMGIREASGPITNNLSSFVPHYIR